MIGSLIGYAAICLVIYWLFEKVFGDRFCAGLFAGLTANATIFALIHFSGCV